MNKNKVVCLYSEQRMDDESLILTNQKELADIFRAVKLTGDATGHQELLNDLTGCILRLVCACITSAAMEAGKGNTK